MEGKMHSGSAPACAQEFVYLEDWKIKQVFSQLWKEKSYPGASWPGKNLALWKSCVQQGSPTTNDGEKFP